MQGAHCDDSRLYDILGGEPSRHRQTSTFDSVDPKERLAKLATGLLCASRERHYSVLDDATQATKRTKASTTQEADDEDSRKQDHDSQKRDGGVEADELVRLQQIIDEDTSPRQDFVDKMTSLRRVYLHGLEQVYQLQDLRYAPDAILPGNIIPHLQFLEAAVEAPASSEPLEKANQLTY